MAELTACKDCQHQISISAHSCPKCGSHRPHGVECLVCKENGGTYLSQRNAHTHPHGKNDWGIDAFYHPECVQGILTIPDGSSCPDCRINLSRSWTWEELCEGHLSCKNCGMVNVFGLKTICAKCKLPILAFHRIEDVGSLYFAGKYHESCFLVVQRLMEQAVKVDPEKRAQAIINGGSVIGAITGLLLGIAISSLIAPGMTEHEVPLGAIIAAGIVGTFLGALLGTVISAFVVSW